MRTRLLPIALCLLLAAPAGFVLAQPSVEGGPGPDASTGPGEGPDAGPAEPIAPRGWEPDDDAGTAAPSTDGSLPDGQPEGGITVQLGPDGLYPVQTGPDGPDAEAVLPPPSDDPSAAQPGGGVAPIVPEGWVPDDDRDAGTVALPRPDIQIPPDGPDTQAARPPRPDAGNQAVETPPAPAATASGLREAGDYLAIRERPLFAPNRSPPRVPEPDPEPETAVAEPEPLPEPAAEVEEVFVETAPDWELVGMVRSERLNSAMFRKFGEADGFSLRRGESRDGWVLAEILRFEVVLENEHGQARLAFPEN